MATAPALARLAGRLRELREDHWSDVRLTQAELAAALGDEEHLAPATVSSWESKTTPKLPPAERLRAYARFFATRRSVEGDSAHLLPLDGFSSDEKAAFGELEAELLGLRDKAARPSQEAEMVT